MEPVVNYMNVIMSVILDSKYTEAQAHTAEWIAKDLEDTMAALPANVCGACTDNTAANKGAWKILEAKFPTKFSHGCVCHALNLLVKDTFGPGKTKWGGNDVPRYPNGYPFEHLANFVDSCKDVVRFIRNNGRLKSALSSLQKANHLGRLVMPAPTRWCTLQQCLVSLHESESLLHDLVSARDFITGSADQRLRRMAVKETVTAVDFDSKLEHCISTLSPIDKWIKIFQSDRVPVSEVFDAFVHQLPHAIGEIWSLNLHESKYIVAAVKARWEFVYGDAHGVGYLLDPRFVDSGFDSMEFKEDVVDFVVNYPLSDTAPWTNSRRDALSRDLKEFQKYCLKLHSAKGWRLEELKSKKKTVAEFWMLDGQAWPLLRELALRVFNLVASSAASERNFSMHGFIQSKKRNRLSPSTVTKLMYIKTNYNLDDEVGGKDYSSDEYTNSE
ncbi:hypothetical protein DYB34_014324 [Aphanomyces astaci]|uniref:HAT C-terminal dimerisation domain-containing protein n=1 Tax=Aphanomyces astaci TaxID=112090 RepID=A0A3R6ZTE0_APHAT|nr:hypothetical protein DYB34_014324 [Aphanomyces astaci]